MFEERIYSVAVMVILVTAVVISATFRSRAARKGRESFAQGEGGWPFILARVILLLGVLTFIGLYVANPELTRWAALPIPDWCRIAGGVLSMTCLPLVWWLFRHLGSNVTPTAETRAGHALVTTGPYRWVRHPLYTVGTGLWIGLSLLAATWLFAALMVPGLTYIAWRTPKEEENLIAEFGEAYVEYRGRTGRYLPRLF